MWLRTAGGQTKSGVTFSVGAWRVLSHGQGVLAHPGEGEWIGIREERRGEQNGFWEGEGTMERERRG